MSQSGKVLHLYVEVRSAPDQSGGKEEIAQGHSDSVQDSPAELLSQLASQTCVTKASAAHRLLQDCTHSQSPSRNSFQLQQASSSPTVTKLRSTPCDGVSAVHSSPMMPSSGKVSVPHTPPNCRRFTKEEVSDGTRSVVTFSYIEKSNVKTVESPRNSVCERGTREERSTPSYFRKRLSDPVWFGSPDSSRSSSPKLTFRSPGSHQQTFSPGLRQSALDPIGRAATQRAVEEFGSPLLRIKLAHALEQSSSSRFNQQPRCQSWAGSPVQRQNISANLKDFTDRSQAICGLPRSPASDQLSSQSRQSPHAKPESCVESQSPLRWSAEARAVAGSPATKRHVHRSCNRSTPTQGTILQLGNNVVEGLNQLSDSKSSSPAHSPEVARRLAEEATKLSSILTEARRSSLHNALGDPAGDFHSPAPNAQQSKQTLKMNIPLNEQHAQATDNTDSHQPETPRTNYQTHQEDRVQKSQHQSSTLAAAQSSPAIPSRVFRPSHPPTELSSPMRDPRLFQAELRAPDTPTLHRRQLRYARDSWTPGLDKRGDLSCFERGDCTELARRLFITQSVEEAPVSWTSRQQWGTQVENSPRPNPEAGFRSVDDQTPERQSSQRRRPLSPTAQQKRAEQRRREILLLGPVVLDSPEEDEGEEGQGDDEMDGYEAEQQRVQEPPEAEHNGAMGGSSSRSSSGVTGSLGDRDCVSPESSQSSHQSNETGAATSGIQTDSGCAVPVPSLHCQRIARAKWEFLFGTPAEEAASRGEKHSLEASTAPPSGNSSESPTPTPPSSLPLLSANHEVQHVEVELLTPPPAIIGTSPKTGIIRRTLKYSETDLDAVPLRCYRETDIDEVLLAEQEDADSAFGSNRSVQGTSGTGSSPLGGLAYGRTDGEEGRGEGEEEDEEEEEEEEEMVSWASVRMQGDNRKQQYAAQEQSDVFGHVLKRPMETFFDSHHPALKSPILVSGPRCAAEDTFSRHFESIMESHRAKGTSYNSLDSEELLTSSTQTVLTFDLPTLTPAIHGPVCQSARQIVQLSFAPLAHDERPSISDSIFTVTGDSDATRAPSSERLSSGSDDTPPKGRGCSQLGSSWYSNPSFSLPSRDKARLATDSELDQDLSERLGLDSSETLTNGSHRADVAAARRLAKRLFNLDGFRKSDVARHLSKNNDFSRMVAEEYLSFFTFTGLALDQALRTFLRQFALMGETQERERVLSHFSKRYLECNPKTIPSEDAVHTLTCALMLLNTDLHGQNIGKRMSCTQFIGNLEGLNDGQDFHKDLLKALYNSIKNQKLQWTLDEEELRKSFSELGDSLCDSSASRSVKGEGSSGKPLPDEPSGSLLYKNGFLVRKVHADSDGKRTPRGKRGWKTFYVILKGLILYLQKGEYRPEKQLSEEDLKNAVSIHHSLAMKASDYSKRPNVFYLRTADWRVYLFQAPNAEQMQSWITRINAVAAMFSAPPFPAAIGSQKKFSRPLLPGTMSKLSEEEQIRSHEARFRALSHELSELRSYTPDRKVKGRELEEHRQRDEYLDFEKTRYATYVMLLRAKVRSGEEDLSVFESKLLEDNRLQRAHSSPTLQDSSQASQISQASSARDGGNSSKASGCSSKPRQEGQRHSYRQAVKK